MKAALFTPLLAVLLSGSSLDQQAAPLVTGRVTDSVTGAPLAGAQVTIVSTRAGAITNADGRYRLLPQPSLRGTQIRLQASMLGYQRSERSLRFDTDSTQVDFALVAATVQSDEVTVAGSGRGGRGGGGARREYASAPAMVTQANKAAPHPGFNTEAYDRINDNSFHAVGAEPLSTFSIDVDRASYSNIRRFIRQGQLPPKDAVRVEEMINYFPYSYAAPSSTKPFSVTTEVAEAPWQPQHRLLRVGLQARRVEVDKLPPNNLVFLIDVSGSMQGPNRLPLVKQSLRLLVAELRPIDRVALVVYAGSAGLVLPSTSGEHRDRILDALNALEAGGSTAGGAGLRLAYEVAKQSHLENGNNRVIIATDGDFNVGVSSDAEMTRLIEERREQGTFLTVLGFGMGNLKDSKLEKLADHGNGNYAYIDDLLEARKVLVTELGGTLLTVAKDVKIQVEFNPAKVRAYRLIGYENRLLRNEDFDNDKKDAGEIGAGHSVTALYELIPVGAKSPIEVREASPRRYEQPAQRSNASSGDELLFVKARYKGPTESTSLLIENVVRDRTAGASEDLRFAASVAAFGMVLRESEFRGNATLDLVLGLARRSVGEDAGGYRNEFIRMVEAARQITAVTASRQ